MNESQIPSDRDRAIYDDVRARGLTIYEAGAKYGLAALTIRDIANRTERQLALRLNELDRLGSLEDLIIDALRLELQWEDTMVWWFRSQTAMKTTRTTIDDEFVDKEKQPKEKRKRRTTTKPQLGNVRYLEQARRIMSDLRVVKSRIYEEQGEADAKLSLDERRAILVGILDKLRERARSQQDAANADAARDDDGGQPARQVLPAPAEPGADGISGPEVP